MDGYARLTRRERDLWFGTMLVVLLSAITIALLTVASAISGVFHGSVSGFVLAGCSFLVFSVFLVYVVLQRQKLRENQNRILKELHGWSGELAQANRAMEEALRTRDVFLNTVSHELKTPLTCILSYAEFLAEETLDPEPVKEHARSILAEGRGLLRLIEQVIDMTRLRSGRFQLHREPADLNVMLLEVIGQSRQEAGQRKVILVDDLAPDPLPVWVDKDRISRTLDLLVRKMIQDSAEWEEVRVESRITDDDWVEVVVCGRLQVPSEGREGESPFCPFADLDPRPNGRSGDLGLLLPLLKRYVMAHGGLLQVEPRPDRRLEICLQLRLDTARHEATEAPREATGLVPAPETLKRAG